jgi:hypothetical protein
MSFPHCDFAIAQREDKYAFCPFSALKCVIGFFKINRVYYPPKINVLGTVVDGKMFRLCLKHIHFLCNIFVRYPNELIDFFAICLKNDPLCYMKYQESINTVEREKICLLCYGAKVLYVRQ